MIKRTIELSERAAHISVRLGQLRLIEPETKDKPFASVPCEDVGLLIASQRQSSYSHSALVELLAAGAAMLVCDARHMPIGMMLPMGTHSECRWRADEQIAGLRRRPLCKRLWTQLVQAKIRGQAANLQQTPHARRTLEAMARRVRSGDPENVEAQAARVYWAGWRPIETFRRRPDSQDSLNTFLNYGYAVLRAGVARAIVASGLLPMLGIKHCNRSNGFALADDLMEPLRPLVDARVLELHSRGVHELSRAAKAGILGVLTQTVICEGARSPLLVSLGRMTASLVACFRGESNELRIPMRPATADDNRCGVS